MTASIMTLAGDLAAGVGVALIAIVIGLIFAAAVVMLARR